MVVTVSDLLTAALALMGADLAGADYEAYTIPSVNLMLCDLFGVNNALLEADGAAALTAIPTVTTVSDAAPYRDELTRNVMPYGLARDLGRMDGNPNLGYYTRMYDQNREMYKIGISEDITDEYPNSDEE